MRSFPICSRNRNSCRVVLLMAVTKGHFYPKMLKGIHYFRIWLHKRSRIVLILKQTNKYRDLKLIPIMCSINEANKEYSFAKMTDIDREKRLCKVGLEWRRLTFRSRWAILCVCRKRTPSTIWRNSLRHIFSSMRSSSSSICCNSPPLALFK